VQDNGPGIPADFEEKISEIFQTLEPRDGVGQVKAPALFRHQALSEPWRFLNSVM
jgi:hypothetical protein